MLQVMRRYIRTFFGCEQCGRHFEKAAAGSMKTVESREQQILWLWTQHNLVNSRLAGTHTHMDTHTVSTSPFKSLSPPPGSLSDDPLFPKAPWPSPSLCPSCHEEKNGVHVWNYDHVILFLRQHYGVSNLSPKYSLTPPRVPAPPQDPDPAQTSRPQGGAGEQREGEERKEPAEEQPGPQGEARGPEGGAGGGGGVWILGLGFNSVDMSLCVVLYICSCLFLMLLFFFFKVRSRRWKLRHSRLHI